MTRSRAGACRPESALGLVAAAGTRWLRRFWVGGLSLVLWVTVLVPLEGGLPVAWADDELFVANVSNNSITVYSRTADGNTAPLRTLQGAATGLIGPAGLAVDLVNNELVVTNVNNSSITVYSRTASGNTAPLRTLQGAATGLSGAGRFGVAVDTVNNEIVVVTVTSVRVYNRTATGNTAPLRTLQGAATGLNFPSGVAVDSVNNELLVTNGGNNSITAYARDRERQHRPAPDPPRGGDGVE